MKLAEQQVVQWNSGIVTASVLSKTRQGELQNSLRDNITIHYNNTIQARSLSLIQYNKRRQGRKGI